MTTIALVAGEDSGDQLGAELIQQLSESLPEARFVGIGGKRMLAAGMDCWWSSEELAVMGLFEVLGQVRRIWKIRKDLINKLGEERPDVFIGIDAPDFNLGLEKTLRKSGVRTVHYVSPTVWAWRHWRVKKVREAADLVLCLFPFEPDFYSDHEVKALYVGHPMADQIQSQASAEASRRELGLEATGQVIALLPGSRVSEVERLADPMLGAARLLQGRYPDVRFIAALANEKVADRFRRKASGFSDLTIHAFEGRVREVIGAADVVLCASGTVTLEAMLINRPMVVAYRLSPATYYFARATRLVKSRSISLPNILAGTTLVPELIQHEASPEKLAFAASQWLDSEDRRLSLKTDFSEMHDRLRCNASRTAARGICELLEKS